MTLHAEMTMPDYITLLLSDHVWSLFFQIRKKDASFHIFYRFIVSRVSLWVGHCHLCMYSHLKYILKEKLSSQVEKDIFDKCQHSLNFLIWEINYPLSKLNWLFKSEILLQEVQYRASGNHIPWIENLLKALANQ